MNTASTLDRHVGRIITAGNAQVKSIEGLSKQSKKLAKHGTALLTELVRPNDKIMECVAKYVEATATMYSTVLTVVTDLTEMLPSITVTIREARDAKGYHTTANVMEAFSKASEKKVNNTNASVN